LALAVALVGFLLSGLSLALVWYFSAHMRRSRAMSEKVLAACRGLKRWFSQFSSEPVCNQGYAGGPPATPAWWRWRRSAGQANSTASIYGNRL
jgi:hypothetical protein